MGTQPSGTTFLYISADPYGSLKRSSLYTHNQTWQSIKHPTTPGLKDKRAKTISNCIYCICFVNVVQACFGNCFGASVITLIPPQCLQVQILLPQAFQALLSASMPPPKHPVRIWPLVFQAPMCWPCWVAPTFSPAVWCLLQVFKTCLEGFSGSTEANEMPRYLSFLSGLHPIRCVSENSMWSAMKSTSSVFTVVSGFIRIFGWTPDFQTAKVLLSSSLSCWMTRSPGTIWQRSGDFQGIDDVYGCLWYLHCMGRWCNFGIHRLKRTFPCILGLA